MSRALQLKDEGNRHFQKGDYTGAESLYSQAIIADPKNATLYTNRAMARLKLSQWPSVITDCETVLTLPMGTSNMKAHYYLAQAQLAIGDPCTALASALHAHKLCAATNDKSLATVTAVVLKCKKADWEEKEKHRTRGQQELEREVMRLLKAETEVDVAAAREYDGEVEAGVVEEEGRAKEERMRDVFERSRRFGGEGEGRREVPDWAIDDISFGFMVDPVMTKTGKSYERASIIEHLRRHPSDPLTREPLLPSDLRPNMALRQACEEFLKDNGWAVDW